MTPYKVYTAVLTAVKSVMAIYPVADMLDYKQIDGSTWDRVVEKFPFLARVLYYMFNI